MLWTELPGEIRLHVIKHCDRDSLKRLRLTSRTDCADATSPLFGVIHLSPNDRSFARARNVAASSHLSRHVKAVIFHVGILEDVHNGYVAFRDDIMRMHRPSGSIEKITEDIIWKYHCFLEEMEGQAIFEGLDQRAEMQSLCANLPSVESITTILDSVNPFDLPEDFVGLRTGVHAVCSADGRHFSNLCIAAAGKALTQIAGRSMSWSDLPPTVAEALPRINLQRMRELSVGLFNYEFLGMTSELQDEVLKALNTFLGATVSSERYYARLDFDEIPFDSVAEDLLPISNVVFKQQWPNLVKLDLMGIVATEDDLISFLSRHAECLRSLHLDDIDLAAESAYNADGVETKLPGSVLSLFRRISEGLVLDSAVISGNFTNRKTEAWYVDPEDDTDSCYRDQIQLWLARKGGCPFPVDMLYGTRRGEDLEFGSLIAAEDYVDESWVWAFELLEGDE